MRGGHARGSLPGMHLERAVRRGRLLPAGLAGPRWRAQYLVAGPLVFAAFSLPYWYQLMSAQHQAAMAGGSEPASRRVLEPTPTNPNQPEPRRTNPNQKRLIRAPACTGWAALGSGLRTGRALGRTRAGGWLRWIGLKASGGFVSQRRGTGSELPAVALSWSDGEEVVRLTEVLQGAGAGAGSEQDGEGEEEEEKEEEEGVGSSGGGVGADAATWAAQLQGAPWRVASFLRRSLEATAAGAAGHQPGCSSAGGATAAGTTAGGGGNGDGCGVEGSSVMVLDAARLAADTWAALSHHSISAALSADLRRWVSVRVWVGERWGMLGGHVRGSLPGVRFGPRDAGAPVLPVLLDPGGGRSTSLRGRWSSRPSRSRTVTGADGADRSQEMRQSLSQSQEPTEPTGARNVWRRGW
ncbi:hypothetical protein TSOC_006300 [Tetrabaena socialis]|uniref:Uncharacterized protein n=1 Tax=Tetrabaena socialis TaxID=47790 RepID=A0A2J8A403_9CHLO|nr:hypothetical protein TSOC_006300 [Tetrabaena socialis]|eukprot:PNH07262.1 hypothetical protein TSOC_006300 [Tetrabaena socialis]